MPNPVDDSRLADTTKGGVVVSLDDYRAQAGTRKTSTPLIDQQTLNVAFVVGVILCVFVLALFMPRSR